jgi:lysophospholipase L1-like esterase
VRNITLIGDSITLGWYPVDGPAFPGGWGVAWTETYPYRLIKRWDGEGSAIAGSDISPWSGMTTDGQQLTPATNKVLTGTSLRCYNAGIGSNSTTQMLARFSSDVLGHTSDALVILAGINDIWLNVATATVETNLAALVTAARAGGISNVHLGTLIPNPSGTGPQRAAVQTVNTWIRSYCASGGALLIDFYAAMESPAGSETSPYLADGLHPSAAGYTIMANALAADVIFATASGDHTTLAWSDNVTGEDGWTLERRRAVTP